jgi:RNA polymerase sigma-70 factor (ECF subfamily)
VGSRKRITGRKESTSSGASDAVQDAFAKAVRKRRSYRGRGSLEAWVWRIVVNAARDARRKRRPLLGLRDRREAANHNGRGETLPLDLLTDRQREVLFLHYYADLDYETIAEALGISPGTVGGARRFPPPAARYGRHLRQR